MREIDREEDEKSKSGRDIEYKSCRVQIMDKGVWTNIWSDSELSEAETRKTFSETGLTTPQNKIFISIICIGQLENC